jgi:hypothetical protein
VTAPVTWEPANEVERALRDAWLRNDTVGYLRTLATAPLYLPGFSERSTTEQHSAQRLLTWQHDERTHLLVFTSQEALRQQLAGVVDGWRLTDMAELARSLPDPDYGIAISPNAPIGACLNPDEVTALAELLADEPAFRPAVPAEAVMFDALREARPAAYLDALMLSPVLVPTTEIARPDDIGRPDFPWRIETVDGEPTLSVFTSDLRMAAAVSDRVPSVRVEMMALAHAWPDPTVRLAVNPASAIAATFTGGQINDLIEWTRRIITRDATPEPPGRLSIRDLLRGTAVS